MANSSDNLINPAVIEMFRQAMQKPAPVAPEKQQVVQGANSLLATVLGKPQGGAPEAQAAEAVPSAPAAGAGTSDIDPEEAAEMPSAKSALAKFNAKYPVGGK